MNDGILGQKMRRVTVGPTCFRYFECVVGRANQFESTSARETVVADAKYTLVQPAKVADIDPVACLADVATRAQRARLSVVLPADFQGRT